MDNKNAALKRPTNCAKNVNGDFFRLNLMNNGLRLPIDNFAYTLTNKHTYTGDEKKQKNKSSQSID